MNHEEARTTLQELDKSIDTKENRDRLVAASEYASEYASAVVRGLRQLKCEKILTQSNFKALVAGKVHAYAVADGLSTLNRAGIILNQANREAIVAAGVHAGVVARGLCRLYDAKIYDPANRAALVDVGVHAGVVVRGLCRLNDAAIILNQDKFNDLVSAGVRAYAVAGDIISSSNPGVVVTNIRAMLAGIGLFSRKVHGTNKPATDEIVQKKQQAR